jgi:uncharacterized membrane protein
MSESRLVAFTDGVIAIIITVMVLEFQAPHEASFNALWAMRHDFAIYLVSYLQLAVYWVNHHHLFQVVDNVSSSILWANILALLVMSFYPFATAWMGENQLTALVPALFYGLVNLLANAAWLLLVQTLINDNRRQGHGAQLLIANRRKTARSVGANIFALATAFIWPPLVIIVDVLTIGAWALPDRRIERHLLRRSQNKNKEG